MSTFCDRIPFSKASAGNIEGVYWGGSTKNGENIDDIEEPWAMKGFWIVVRFQKLVRSKQ